jgi:DNA-binding LytR/AlgR family response regulator
MNTLHLASDLQMKLMNKNILIVEDELVIAENTRLLILQFYPDALIEIAGSAKEAYELLEHFTPSVALLDIRLGDGENGISFSKTLASKNIPYLFLTAHGDTKTISSAIQNSPLGYLIKPITKQELFAGLELAFAKINSEKFLIFRDGTHDVRIPQKDITHIKSDGHYTEVHTDAKRYVIRKSMRNVLDELSVEFIQSHRSYFVNPDYIREINALVYLISGEELPLSRNYKPAILERLFATK